MEQAVSPHVSQLDYAPAAPARRRRRWRRAIYLLMALSAGVALWRAGPPFFRQAVYVYWQSRCMSFTRPADFVAYEEDPTRRAVLLNRPNYITVPRQSQAAGFSPPPLARVWSNPTCAAVFLHERTTPSGRRRVVIVGPELLGRGIWSGRGGGPERVVEITASSKVAATLLPGSELARLSNSRLCLILRGDQVLRVYWGQPDPQRGDRFTIGYELDGKAGTIDGLLKDDGQVDLSVRDGPAGKMVVKLPY